MVSSKEVLNIMYKNFHLCSLHMKTGKFCKCLHFSKNHEDIQLGTDLSTGKFPNDNWDMKWLSFRSFHKE